MKRYRQLSGSHGGRAAAAMQERCRRGGVVLAVATMMALFVTHTALPEELPTVGSCTPGESQCQVNQVVVCACYEEWRETPEGETRAVAVCVWEYFDEYCGEPSGAPQCMPGRRGAEVRFASGEIKTCRCYGNDCYWE